MCGPGGSCDSIASEPRKKNPTRAMSKGEMKYGDWRDKLIAEGIPLSLEDSSYAAPMCPRHGWITMRKKKINVWKCSACDFEVSLDEQEYRAWRAKAVNAPQHKMPPIKTEKSDEEIGIIATCPSCHGSFPAKDTKRIKCILCGHEWED